MWDTIGIWVEAVALIAIFVLELWEYHRQGQDRKAQHEETLAQMEVMRRHMLATETGTKAAETSSAVQQAAMRQWVLFQQWSTKQDISDIKGRFAIEVCFEIVNPTDLPLTMLTTKLKLPYHESWRRYNIVLPPHLPYSVRLSGITLNEHDAALYKSGQTIGFLTYGLATYRDCFDTVREQDFSGVLRFSLENARFESVWFPDNPLTTKQEKSEQQNPSHTTT